VTSLRAEAELDSLRAWERETLAKPRTSQKQRLSADEQRSRDMVNTAKKLIVDSFPEDRGRAELLLVDAIRLAPRNIEAYADLSRFVLWQIANGLKEPAEIQRSALLAAHVRDLAPERPLGNYLVCEILLAMGQTAQAAALFESASKRFPEHLDTKVFESRYWSDSNPDKAIESAQDALERGHPMDDLSPAIALALTKATQRGGTVGERLSRFAAVYPDRWLWHRAGMALAEENSPDKARDAYLKAVSLGNEMESRLQLGVLEYAVLRRFESASAHLERVREVLDRKAEDLGTRVSTADSKALVLSHLAIARLGANDETQAAATGREAVLAGMRNANILVPLTEEFLRRRKGELLRPGLEEIVKRDPLQEYVHVTLANLASERKDLQAASDHFTAAIALQPTRDDLFSSRGHVSYRALRYDTALRDFERASTLRPDQPTHHYNRACMLSLLGRKQEAVVALREAIGMNAELRELALRDADLAPLRKDESYAQELSALGLTTAAKPAKNADESFVQAASESDADSNDNAAGP
jgi:tetratricopeptide (TPR) repeat protein